MFKKENVGSLKKEIERLRRLAFFDELTGLLNRHGFKEEAHRFLGEIAFEKTGSEKRKNMTMKNFSIVFFDADYFKKINDTYGHPAGDKALKILGEIITDRVRSVDLVARWGGEEVIVGLVGASENEAAEVAENIRRRVESVGVAHKKKEVKFTVSAGVAASDGEVDISTLIDRADGALYKAKHSGRNRVVKFSDL